MPRKLRVVGSYPTQGNSFFFEKKGCSGFVELFAFALLITSLMTYVFALSGILYIFFIYSSAFVSSDLPPPLQYPHHQHPWGVLTPQMLGTIGLFI